MKKRTAIFLAAVVFLSGAWHVTSAFAWEKAVARARAGMNKSRASGLQLVLALTTELRYEDDGRVACARMSKRTAEDAS